MLNVFLISDMLFPLRDAQGQPVSLFRISLSEYLPCTRYIPSAQRWVVVECTDE